MDIDHFPLWKRALFWNVVGLIGLLLGFASAQRPLPLGWCVPFGIFFMAVFNLMFLVVRPRLLICRTKGQTPATLSHVLLNVFRERPLVILVIVLQLVGTSRAGTTAAKFIRWAHSDYVHRLPNASATSHRMVMISFSLIGVGLIWLASAVGLWMEHSWGWWLGLVLNGLSAAVVLVVQMLNWRSFPWDATSFAATLAVIVLLLPKVRNRYLSRPTEAVEPA